ncbi:MAG TPA: hypothetical protein V6C72_08635, partial [Chroococcales cyanobacterium]
ATSPPVVACSVYLALTASTGTLIVYTAMSLLGMYGDWKNIYTSPLSNWVFITGLCHGALVALIVYAVTDDKTRTWYACKTTPEWAARYREAKEAAESEPTAANVLHLAWIYYEGGISKGARRCVNRCKELDPTEYGAWFLEGWIDLQERKISRAEKTFGEIVSSQNADSTLKARALMAIAETALYKIETATRSAPTSPQAYMSVLQAYKAAAQAEPDLADPVFLRARILNKVGLYKQAEHELRSLTDLKWLNPELQALVPAQLQIASEKVAENE